MYSKKQTHVTRQPNTFALTNSSAPGQGPGERSLLMSAIGSFGSLADILRCGSYVRFTPNSGHVQYISPCLLCANSGHRAVQSITWSARASSAGGTVRLSALAVLRLIASSYLVGACTGRSAGFSPLRIRST